MLLTALGVAATLSAARQGAALAAFVHHHLHFDLTPANQVAWFDLNGDGRDEALVYLRDPTFCGSGGCTLLIATPTRRGFRRIGYVTTVQPPIGVLTSLSHGWRDMAVGVGGGGVAYHRMKLRFGGVKYSISAMGSAVPLAPRASEHTIVPQPKREGSD